MEKNRNIQIQDYKQRSEEMSHFISGASVSPEPILDKKKLRKVIAPKFQHILKDNNYKESKMTSTWAQESAIANLCKKLTDREYVLLRRQNANEMEHNFAKLKEKLKKEVVNNHGSVTNFFDNHKEDNTINVKQMMSRMPLRISLSQKYNAKLVNWAQTIHNTHQINLQKQKYAKWFDRQNNSPIKSPNYHRMSFLLQRLQSSANRILTENNRKSQNQMQSVVKPKLQNYVASRRLKTIGNQSNRAFKQ